MIRKLSFHDHPHMAVLSKVLFGELERTSVDLTQEEDPFRKKSKKKHSHAKTSEKKRFFWRKSRVLKGKNRVLGNIANRDIVKSPSIMRLTPLVENIHSLKAKTDCILFDVLIPNYDNALRQCRFYKEIESEMTPMLTIAKKIKNETDPGGLNGKNGDFEAKIGPKSENEPNLAVNERKNDGKQEKIIMGTIVLEEIEEPEEIESFVVVAFPRSLALKLQ